MKYFLLSLLGLSILASCGHGGGTDKHAELDKLKKEQAAIREKISALEAELAASDTASEKAKFIAATDMQPTEFRHYIEVQAKVEGDKDVTVSAQSMGTVTAVNVNAGDVVSKGQVLATIDDRIIRQGLEEVQTQLELATQIYNKQKNLWEQKIGSEVQFLQAKTNKQALEKRMASLQEQLDLTRIKAPINGTVDKSLLKEGQSVAPGVPAFRVVNLELMKVTAEVAESFINRVHKGDQALIYFPDINKEISAKLDYSGKAINLLNRTFNVEVRLNGNNGDYHPNMVAVLKIVDYASPKAFVLPLAAVQKSSDGEFVYVIDNAKGKMTARRKIVTTGSIYNGMTEIVKGLDAGDKVITTGYQNVIDGDPVTL